MELVSEILRSGHTIGEDNKPVLLHILKQNWDFYYEEGNDCDEPDLDENGFAYYVLFGEFNDILYANRSKTCLSEVEAIQLAEETFKSKIVWQK